MISTRERLTEGMTRARLALDARRAMRPLAVWLALVVLGLAAAAFILSRIDIALPWQTARYQLRVYVDNAKGVYPGNGEVRISGLEVGRIVGVGLAHSRPYLSVDIDPAYAPLYRDARLRLRPRTPLEDMYLDVVSRGTPAAGVIRSGGAMPAERTETSVYIGEVLDVFNDDVRTRIKEAIDNAGRGLGPEGVQFRAALVELAPFLAASRSLARENAIRAEETRRLVHNFTLLTEELARRQGQVTRLVGAGGAALGELASVDQQLSATFVALPPVLRQLPSTFTILRATADHLDPAFEALLPAAHALPTGMSALQDLAPDLQSGAAGLREPLPSLDRLVRRTAPVARELRVAFGELTPTAPRLNRITTLAVPCERALQDALQWSLSVFKFYNTHGVLMRVQDVASAESAGGQAEPAITALPSCAPGEPAK